MWFLGCGWLLECCCVVAGVVSCACCCIGVLGVLPGHCYVFARVFWFSGWLLGCCYVVVRVLNGF